jgi:predicted HD superfamily hydrolase involved in NAD metabolism
MGELAEIYGLDHAQAMTAGLLHDAAKDLPPERQLALAEEANIEFSHPCERHPVYLHAPLGAYVASRDLGVRDGLVLEAIASHSYIGNGANFDAPFSWCLRFADLLAPVQEWQGMDKLKNMVYAGRSNEAALLQCRWLIEYFQEFDVPVHPSLEGKFVSLAARLGVDDSFFERW